MFLRRCLAGLKRLAPLSNGKPTLYLKFVGLRLCKSSTPSRHPLPHSPIYGAPYMPCASPPEELPTHSLSSSQGVAPWLWTARMYRTWSQEGLRLACRPMYTSQRYSHDPKSRDAHNCGSLQRLQWQRIHVHHSQKQIPRQETERIL